MDTGIYLAGSKNNLALGVETCQCANAYSGSSCQDPSEGYFRWTEITITETEEFSYEQYVGKSIPCNCNGRSLSCNRETGHCEVCEFIKICFTALTDLFNSATIFHRDAKRIRAGQIVSSVPKVFMGIHSIRMDVNRVRAQRQAKTLQRDAHSKRIVSAVFVSQAIRAIFVNSVAWAISVYPIMTADIVRNAIVIQTALFPTSVTN